MIEMEDNTRFQLKTILYSRSDPQGNVTAGNANFQAVSGYSWDKLFSAPHKLLRHDATPQGIFHMLWSTLQDDKPLGGYFLNRAEDGSTYWVFATVIPVTGGYVSIRLKPSCGLLDKLIPVYEDLRTQERNKTMTPQQSADRIDAAVQDLGYKSYSEFMSFALRDEMMARNSSLDRGIVPIWDMLSDIYAEIARLEQRAHDIGATFRKTHQIPYNMRLQAGRLETSDGPISVISSNHRQMTQTLEQHLGRFIANSRVGADAVRGALFKSCVGCLVDDVLASGDGGAEFLGDDPSKERGFLSDLQATCQEAVAQDVAALSDNVRNFASQSRDIRRMMSGLELTRIMCKIERSKFKGDLDGLDEIVRRLEDAQNALSVSFDEIMISVSKILNRAKEVTRSGSFDKKQDVSAAA